MEQDLKEQQHISFINGIIFRISLQMSMSEDASFPVGAKWIRMNLPCVKEREQSKTENDTEIK